MKKYFVILLSLYMITCNAQNGLVPRRDIDILKYYTWTDGQEFYKYVSPDVKKIMGFKNPASQPGGENLYMFCSRTRNEGGSILILRESSGDLFLENIPDFPNEFNNRAKGEIVRARLDEDKEYLILYTKTECIGSLKLIDQKEDISRP